MINVRFDNIKNLGVLQLIESTSGLVFGIPISQCLENDRLGRIATSEVADVGCLSRTSRHGSRTSFTSLIEPPTSTASKTDEVRNIYQYVFSK